MAAAVAAAVAAAAVAAVAVVAAAAAAAVAVAVEGGHYLELQFLRSNRFYEGPELCDGEGLGQEILHPRLMS